MEEKHREAEKYEKREKSMGKERKQIEQGWREGIMVTVAVFDKETLNCEARRSTGREIHNAVLGEKEDQIIDRDRFVGQ